MEDFAFYVEDSEWFKFADNGLHCLRGSLIKGRLPDGGLYCASSLGGETLFLKEETFRPTRPGLDGKILSHAMQERSFVSNQKPSLNLNGSILFAEGTSVEVTSVNVLITKNFLFCDGERLDMTETAIPICIDKLEFYGVLIFEDNEIGVLKLLNTSSFSFGGELDLRLVNESVQPGVVFKILVE